MQLALVGAIIIKTLRLFLEVFNLLVFISVILSWIPPLKLSNFGRAIDRLVGPILDYFSVPIFLGPIGIDLGPILALIFMNLAENLLERIVFIIFF